MIDPNIITQSIPLELHVAAKKNGLSLYGIDNTQVYRHEFLQLKICFHTSGFEMQTNDLFNSIPNFSLLPSIDKVGLIVAVDENNILMGGLMFFLNKLNCEIQLLATDPVNSKGRKGIGSFLLTASVSVAMKLKMAKVSFITTMNAKSFYESLDFKFDSVCRTNLSLPLSEQKNALFINNTSKKYTEGQKYYLTIIDQCIIKSIQTDYLELDYCGEKLPSLRNKILYLYHYLNLTGKPIGTKLRDIQVISTIDLAIFESGMELFMWM